ncbi:MAG: hypothetical protein M1819_005567 [Sarea resinae]|nr:MAG: hypothetical protein M1819_005567 [Sarea resinae]
MTSTSCSMFLSLVVFCFCCHLSLADAKPSIWGVHIDEGPAPPPDECPPISRGASRDKSLLAGQICGIVGSYLATACIVASAIFFIGRRLRRQIKTHSLVSMEMLPPVMASKNNYDPSPVSGYTDPFKTPTSGASAAKFAWPSPGKKKNHKGIGQLSQQNSVVTFDEHVIENDRLKREEEMERLYNAVMGQEARRPMDLVYEREADQDFESWDSPPPQHGVAASPPPLPSSPQESAEHKKSRLSRLSMGSLASKVSLSTINSNKSWGKGRRPSIRDLGISGPIASPQYSQFDYARSPTVTEASDAEAYRSPTTPRLFFESPPSPVPPPLPKDSPPLSNPQRIRVPPPPLVVPPPPLAVHHAHAHAHAHAQAPGPSPTTPHEPTPSSATSRQNFPQVYQPRLQKHAPQPIPLSSPQRRQKNPPAHGNHGSSRTQLLPLAIPTDHHQKSYSHSSNSNSNSATNSTTSTLPFRSNASLQSYNPTSPAPQTTYAPPLPTPTFLLKPSTDLYPLAPQSPNQPHSFHPQPLSPALFSPTYQNQSQDQSRHPHQHQQENAPATITSPTTKTTVLSLPPPNHYSHQQHQHQQTLSPTTANNNPDPYASMPYSARTPGGLPQVPYSPYMPMTPMTPVTPRLVTRQERRMRERERGRRLATQEEDLVEDEDEMW